jgi:hypothetical protein
MARDGHLHLRIRAELRAKLARVAATDKRTLSNYVEKLLDEHVANATAVKKAPPKGGERQRVTSGR